MGGGNRHLVTGGGTVVPWEDGHGGGEREGGGRLNSDRPPASAPLPLYIGLRTIKGALTQNCFFFSDLMAPETFSEYDFFSELLLLTLGWAGVIIG